MLQKILIIIKICLISETIFFLPNSLCVCGFFFFVQRKYENSFLKLAHKLYLPRLKAIHSQHGFPRLVHVKRQQQTIHQQIRKACHRQLFSSRTMQICLEILKVIMMYGYGFINRHISK